MLSEIINAIDTLPFIDYDTAFPVEELINNRPYRNVADLLIRRQESVKTAMRLCGCEEGILQGAASDYEVFRALCLCMPLLVGHRTARQIAVLLERVFGVTEQLSLYTCDTLWKTLTAAIEEEGLRPTDIVAALGVSSIACRLSPFVPLPARQEEEPTLRPLFDLGIPEKAIISENNTAEDFEHFLCTLTDRLDAFLAVACPAVCLTLPSDYRYQRNSKKKEIDDSYRAVKTNVSLSAEAINALRTAIFVRIAEVATKKDLPLLLTSNAHEEELIKLYSYLKRNATVPVTVLKAPTHRQFTKAFAFRHERGFPGILPISTDLASLAEGFPLGTAILPNSEITDTVSLADGILRRRELAELLANIGRQDGIDIDTLTSLAEDIAFGNIINRFGM